MRRLLLSACVLVAIVGTARAIVPVQRASAAQPVTAQPPAAADDPQPTFSTEQEWIVSEVVDAVAGTAHAAGASRTRVLGVRTGMTGAEAPAAFVISLADGRTIPITIVEHIWSPQSYAAFAGELLAGINGGDGTPTDFRVRVPLADLTSDTLLEQSERVSAALAANLRSASAHESAALIVAALALRESPGSFSDVRAELSRTTAHLAIARVLRGAFPIGPDGALAEAVLTVLAGRQRDALSMIDGIDEGSSAPEDRTWTRTLRLRVTGDWRTGPPALHASRLEQVEYARALRTRAGNDAFLTYLDFVESEDLAAWQRIAYGPAANVELYNRFNEKGIERELSEARRAWSRMHPGLAVPADFSAALNARSAPGPVTFTGESRSIHVLDWGRMAAFHQRHLVESMLFADRQLWALADHDGLDALAARLDRTYHGLYLYPLVARWTARTAARYQQALEAARPLVDTAPFLVTAAAWNGLLDKPEFVTSVPPFPLEQRWFMPYVPAGTLYDLSSRSLRPGCRRPPSIEQARAWSAQAPFDFWVRWSAEWYAVPGEPAVRDLKRALGPLLEYDEHALTHLLDHVTTGLDDQIATARKLCSVNPGRCDALAKRLLLDGRESEALAVYETWIENTRDTVLVSNELTWIVRYYLNHGNPERAMALARRGAETSSAAGLETLAHALDRTGTFAESEAVYKNLAAHYDNPVGLGVAYLRQGIRTGDAALQARGMELVRHDLPDGMEPLVLHALDATPHDGIAFANFGPRPAAAGLQPFDVLVGMDGWRIRSMAHWWVATRLRHEDATTVTVWRNGAYKQLHTHIPERWLGATLRNYVPPVARR